VISVALIEDDGEIRDSLSILISGTPGYSCDQKYESVESALASIFKHSPDVILMDIELGGMSGIEGVRQIKQKLPEIDIIMLTVHEDDESVFESLCAAASGYLPKNTPPSRLLEAINEVHDGGSPMGRNIARMVVSSFKAQSASPLSEREHEVLTRLCAGDSYKEIAEKLFVTEETIRSHIKNIYRKLEVHSKSEAVAKAMRTKIVGR
jgi:DNA-binding NarL/FixJ family response regulator